MKVLIVDDNVEKIRRLAEHLVSTCRLDRNEDITVSQCALDARRQLKTESFDIMILDILLPSRPEDEPKPETCLDLLTEITDRGTLKRPRQIIGLTAYDHIADDFGHHFSQRLWTVVSYDQSSEEWLERIEGCVKYMQGSTADNLPITYQADLCVITALQDIEASALYRIDWKWRPAEPLDDTMFIRRGVFTSEGQTFSVVSITAPRMGMVSSALTAAKAIERIRPRFLAMIGICAGVEGKANLGDVILADTSWDYQSGKRVPKKGGGGLAIDPHQIAISSFVRASGEQLRGDHALWHSIRMGWAQPPGNELKMIIAPMASGSAVLADAEILANIVDQQRKVAGVEMETYGVYAAAQLASYPRPTALAFKSVCDFGDANKNDAMQGYAAYTSAMALKAFFERNMVSLQRLAGS